MRIVAFIFMVALTGCFGRQPLKTGHEGEHLPPFDILLLDSVTKVTTSQVKNKDQIDAVVLLLFSPDCPHCRVLTSQLVDSIKSVHRIKFYLLSISPYDMIKKYAEHYHLNKYPTITVGQDYKFGFVDYFKPPGVPYVVIYGKDLRLKQVLSGKLDISAIKDIALQ